MNKVEMVDKVSGKFGVTKKDAEELITFVLDECATAALKDGRVRFGSHRFEKVERAGRKGRNPKTGAVIEIPPKVKVTYRNVSL